MPNAKQQLFMNQNKRHPGYLIRPPHDVYPQDIQCVYGDGKQHSIFIGNLQSAENLQTLKKLKIGALLTSCFNIHIDHNKKDVPYYLYIPGQDHSGYDLSIHFEKAIQFIKNSIQYTNVLVHCMAGISRSVTLVIAYLIKEQHISLELAFSMLKKRRRIINPNRGFMRQLEIFEKQYNTLKNRRNSCQNMQYMSPKSIKYNPSSQNKINMVLNRNKSLYEYQKMYEIMGRSYHKFNKQQEQSKYQKLLGQKYNLKKSAVKSLTPQLQSTYNSIDKSNFSTSNHKDFFRGKKNLQISNYQEFQKQFSSNLINFSSNMKKYQPNKHQYPYNLEGKKLHSRFNPQNQVPRMMNSKVHNSDQYDELNKQSQNIKYRQRPFNTIHDRNKIQSNASKYNNNKRGRNYTLYEDMSQQLDNRIDNIRRKYFQFSRQGYYKHYQNKSHNQPLLHLKRNISNNYKDVQNSFINIPTMNKKYSQSRKQSVNKINYQYFTRSNNNNNNNNCQCFCYHHNIS